MARRSGRFRADVCRVCKRANGSRQRNRSARDVRATTCTTSAPRSARICPASNPFASREVEHANAGQHAVSARRLRHSPTVAAATASRASSHSPRRRAARAQTRRTADLCRATHTSCSPHLNSTRRPKLLPARPYSPNCSGSSASFQNACHVTGRLSMRRCTARNVALAVSRSTSSTG